MPASTEPWDAAAYLDTPEAVSAYLEAAFEENDPAVIAHCLGVIARARGMTQVAREAGVTREALYKALSTDGDPRLSTLLKVVKALGLRISAAPAVDVV